MEGVTIQTLKERERVIDSLFAFFPMRTRAKRETGNCEYWNLFLPKWEWEY
jgi:hypothetical protein